MRICAICQTYLPEQGSVFLGDLVSRWEAAGHDVAVWTAGPRAEGQPGRIVRPFPLPYSRRSIAARIATQAGFVAGCAAGLSRARFDLVLFASAPGWGGALGVSVRGPTVHWVMDLYPEAIRAQWPDSAAARMVGGPMRAAIDAAWRRAGAIVTLTDRMAEKIRRRVPDRDVRVIGLWAPDDVRPRAEDGPFTALYHGSLGIAYDFAPILDAASLLGDVAFVLVGQGAQRSWIEREIARRELHNVIVRDPVPEAELSASLASGHVHMVSVRPGWDGVAFQSKIIGALAAGRPVVLIGPTGTEIGRMLDEDACGVVAHDGAELASAIAKLQGDPERRARMGEAARACAERRFSRAAAMTAWDGVIAAAAPR